MSEDQAGQSTEVALLLRIDGKVDHLAAQLDAVGRRAAVTGALSGSIAGGVVTVAIHYIKLKMGW